MKKAKSYKSVTLSDIAKHTGMSVSTVSRALNNAREISKKTRNKILEAANELNYTPNDMARNLVTKSNNTIAAIVPDILNPYYSELIKSIETVLSQNNFALLLCITNESDAQTDYFLNDMLRKRVSGVLLLSTIVKNSALLEKVKQNTILVGISACHDNIDQVAIREDIGTYNIVKHLIDLGHRRIAFIGYKLYEYKVLTDRLKGYKKALKEKGIGIDESLIIDGEATGYPGYNETKKVLDLKNRPTAIHCMNEYLAMGAYIAICNEGLKIPQDISLTGHDGLEITKVIQPRLTTVKSPVPAMGEAAAEMILQRITFGKKKERQLLLFDSNLEIGRSTKSINI